MYVAFSIGTIEKLKKSNRGQRQMILPEFKIINTNTGEEIRAGAIAYIDYVSETIKYVDTEENKINRTTSHVSFTDKTLGLEDAKFVYTKAIADIQQDISDWIVDNKEELEEGILKSVNKVSKQYLKEGTVFDITNVVDKDNLVEEVAADIVQGLLNVIATYKQEV